MDDYKPIDFDFLLNETVEVGSGSTEVVPEEPKKKRTKRVSKKVEKVDGDVVDTAPHSIDDFSESINALKGAVRDIDTLSMETHTELENVRSSRTIKNKYGITSSLTENITDLLTAKITAIREINSTIKTAKEMDMKLRKETAAAAAGNDDEKIMSMYNAFLASPVSAGRTALGPTTQDFSLATSLTPFTTVPPIDGKPQTGDNPIADPGFINYMNNLTPEQNRAIMSSNPDVKEVVLYNESTGEKHFAVVNTKTNEIINNIAHHDDSYLEDCTLSPRTGMVRNSNLNESYELIKVDNSGNILKGF